MTRRILFFTKIDFSARATGGLFRKVKAEAKALASYPGQEVDLFYIQGLEAVWEFHNGQVDRVALPSQRARARYTNVDVFAVIARHQYQVIYIRHFLLNPVFVLHLKKWKRTSPDRRILLELPTWPYRPEFRDASFKVRMQVLLDLLTFRNLSALIDRIVTFSRESVIHGIPTIQTDNGVDPETITPLQRVPHLPPFRILGLANLNIWHGYDRMIKGMAEWAKSGEEENIHFDIAGSGKEEQNLRDLVTKLDVQHLVTFHGFLQGEALDSLIAQCHVGLASLGMHRTGVAEGQTTTLKAREFAARGLPFILGYADHDFGTAYPFCYIETSDERPVDPRTLLAFYSKVRQEHPTYYETMRKDAQDRLSWNAKLLPVNKFLETREH